jgi:hypothetical protein
LALEMANLVTSVVFVTKSVSVPHSQAAEAGDMGLGRIVLKV